MTRNHKPLMPTERRQGNNKQPRKTSKDAHKKSQNRKTLSSRTCNALRCGFVSKQQVIVAGQKDVDFTECGSCQMLFTVQLEAERRLHYLYHSEMMRKDRKTGHVKTKKQNCCKQTRNKDTPISVVITDGRLRAPSVSSWAATSTLFFSELQATPQMRILRWLQHFDCPLLLKPTGEQFAPQYTIYVAYVDSASPAWKVESVHSLTDSQRNRVTLSNQPQSSTSQNDLCSLIKQPNHTSHKQPNLCFLKGQRELKGSSISTPSSFSSPGSPTLKARIVGVLVTRESSDPVVAVDVVCDRDGSVVECIPARLTSKPRVETEADRWIQDNTEGEEKEEGEVDPDSSSSRPVVTEPKNVKNINNKNNPTADTIHSFKTLDIGKHEVIHFIWTRPEVRRQKVASRLLSWFRTSQWKKETATTAMPSGCKDSSNLVFDLPTSTISAKLCASTFVGPVAAGVAPTTISSCISCDQHGRQLPSSSATSSSATSSHPLFLGNTNANQMSLSNKTTTADLISVGPFLACRRAIM